VTDPGEDGSGTVRLYHGTTDGAADCIQTEGWTHVDVAAMVEEVAVHHGESSDEVWRWLRRWARFATFEGRGDSAWFCGSRTSAQGWAERAPEARWEALWAIWSIRNGVELNPYEPDAQGPWNLPAAAAWHTREMSAFGATVLTVEVPLDSLRASVSEHDYEWLREGTDLEDLPEIKLELPIRPEFIVGREAVDRRVDFIAAAALLGLSNDELTEAIRAGVIREPDQPEITGTSWTWPWSELSQRIAE